MRSSSTRSGLCSRNAASALSPSAHSERLEAFAAQHDAEHLGQCGVVVDDEHASLHELIVTPRGTARRRDTADDRVAAGSRCGQRSRRDGQPGRRPRATRTRVTRAAGLGPARRGPGAARLPPRPAGRRSSRRPGLGAGRRQPGPPPSACAAGRSRLGGRSPAGVRSPSAVQAAAGRRRSPASSRSARSGVGEILDGAISTIRAKPRMMLGLSALVAVAHPGAHRAGHLAAAARRRRPRVQLRPATAARRRRERPRVRGQRAHRHRRSRSCITLVATLLLTGILTVVLSRAVLGQDIDAGEAWAQARPRLPGPDRRHRARLVIVLGARRASPSRPGSCSPSPARRTPPSWSRWSSASRCSSSRLLPLRRLRAGPAAVVLEKQRSSRRCAGRARWSRARGGAPSASCCWSTSSPASSPDISPASSVRAPRVAGGAGTGFDDLNPYALLPLHRHRRRRRSSASAHHLAVHGRGDRTDLRRPADAPRGAGPRARPGRGPTRRPVGDPGTPLDGTGRRRTTAPTPPYDG